MKAKRRHELSQNVLARDLGKAGDFLSLHYKVLLAGFLVAAVIAGLVIWGVSRWRSGRESQWATLYALNDMSWQAQPDQAAQQLQNLADSASQDSLAAWSYVSLGKARYMELMLKYPKLDPSGRQQLSDEASAAYRKVANAYPSQKAALGQAYVGLGLLAEMKGDFTAARDQYNRAASLDSAQAGLAVAQADARLAQMDQWQTPVAFPASAPAPGSQPVEASSAPASRPAASVTTPSTVPAQMPVASKPLPAIGPTTRPAK